MLDYTKLGTMSMLLELPAMSKTSLPFFAGTRHFAHLENVFFNKSAGQFLMCVSFLKKYYHGRTSLSYSEINFVVQEIHISLKIKQQTSFKFSKKYTDKKPRVRDGLVHHEC